MAFLDINRDEAVNLVGNLSCASAPSGFEDEVCAIVHEFAHHELSEGTTFTETNLRNCLLKPAGMGDPAVEPEACRVLLDAHADEVGAMIKSIRPNGMMTFIQLGHYTTQALAGEHFLVRNTLGDWLDAVVVAKPPHFQTAAEKANSQVSEFLLDCGATSAEDARENFHMAVGEPAVPATDFSYDTERGVMFGKAFDDRAGIAAMLLALKTLEETNTELDYVATVSSQEEVGERGIGACVNWAQPNCAIMFEGAPADDQFAQPADVQCALKRGPMIRFADCTMITNPRFMRFALDVAAKYDIPVQTAVRDGGGTNAAATHVMHEGIPALVISVPCRQIHAGCSIAAIEDVENAARLGAAIVRELSCDIVDNF